MLKSRMLSGIPIRAYGTNTTWPSFVTGAVYPKPVIQNVKYIQWARSLEFDGKRANINVAIHEERLNNVLSFFTRNGISQ